MRNRSATGLNGRSQRRCTPNRTPSQVGHASARPSGPFEAIEQFFEKNL
ncbi:hypothetical protein BPSOL_0111 [Bifidobacterium pseudolongum]|nr:hypothetical protein BPSOL_0111 [Bifidobacterium pseudolongum]